MTRLLIDPTVDLPGTGPVTLTATLLDPDPVNVQAFTVLDATSVVDLPAPAPADAWRLTVRRGGHIVEERTVHWGAAPSIAWGALTDVDPGSLQAVTGSPLLDLSLAELRAAILGGASAAYDTLKELEDALNGDTDAVAALTAAVAGKATPAQITAAIQALNLGTASTRAATDFATPASAIGAAAGLAIVFG